ncbi:TIGR01906 family membrane protein [Chloroflexota bacterium]
MRNIGIVAKWFFVLCLPVLLLTISIGGAVNSRWLYKYGFDKYNISSSTGLANSELDKTASGLINYFNSGEEYISLTVVKNGKPFELFNQREVSHLKDVKGLIWLNYWVLLGTLIYVLVYTVGSLFRQKRAHWQRLAWEVAGGSSLTLALMLALGLGTLFNFDRLFLQFHLFSFANDFWQLDPAKDYLIMLFPQGFWYDATLFCVLLTVGMAIILGGLAVGHLLCNRGVTTSR